MGKLLLKTYHFDENTWYAALVDDCKDIITEAVFTSRWAKVEGYWRLGERIREEGEKVTKSLQGLAVDIGVSERTLWNALAVYDKYPDLQAIPEGKNISWNKLVTKYLPKASGEKDSQERVWRELYRCPKCGKIQGVKAGEVCECEA